MIEPVPVIDGRRMILFVHTQSRLAEFATIQLRALFRRYIRQSICGQPTQLYIILMATFRVGIFPLRWRISALLRLSTRHVPPVGQKSEEYPLKERMLLGASVRVAGKLVTIVKLVIVQLH